MARLAIRVLGPFQAILDGELIGSFHSDKVRALLAYLCVGGEKPHRREKLAGLLWPDLPERSARTNLRHALANLRQVIGDREADSAFLSVTRQTIQFTGDSDVWIDALAFSSALQSPQGSMPQLEEVVAWYHGEFLEGFSLPDSAIFEEWLLLQREHFQRLVLDALHRLAKGCAEQNEYERALTYAWRQVELDPWREKAHRQVIHLLALSGRRSEALAQYNKCRLMLAEELGVEPSVETTRLYEQIRDEALTVTMPSADHYLSPTHNLPVAPGPFVGREEEITQIQDCLRDTACRLLTLVGAGGIGKTRLALEAVTDWLSQAREETANRLRHGVYLVRLAPLQTAEAIVPTVAQAIGFQFAPGREPRQQQLLEALSRKRMLLILDNFEHLMAGVELVAEVLRSAPHLTVLITSRARLNLQGEQIFPVGGIDFPAQVPDDAQIVQGFAAVGLFLQTTRQVRPGFEPTNADLIAIAHICRQVQGMPLGILLAAAWMGILSPAEITAEISRGLDFLETDWHDLPERQRNLHAVFDGSWNLLTEREREVFQALALFRGGFTREAAQQVAGASLHDLKALSDKSLLQYVLSGRYEIHGLLRQYAAEKLDSSPNVRAEVGNRHCAYYTAALEQWEADLTGSRQQVATVEMEAESANIDAAWCWAVERAQVERLARSMEGLALFYWLRGRYKEGEAAMQAAASTLAAAASNLLPTSSDNLRPWIRALVWRSNFCRKLGRRDQVVQLHRQALALLEESGLAEQAPVPSLPQDTRFERALLLQSMGRAVFMSDYERGRQLHEEALALFRELDDRRRVASVLIALGRAAYVSSSPVEAKQRFTESLALYQGIGDQLGIARSMANLSLVALYEGHFEEAERLARQATDRLRQYGSRTDLTYGLDVLGSALEGAGRFGKARAVLNEALAIHTELSQRHYLAFSHAPLSRIHLHLGQYQEAQTYAQTGLANAREADIKFAVGHTLSVLGCVAVAQGACAEAYTRLQESVTVYRVIGHWDDLSQAHTLLGCAARGLGDLRLAREYLVEALLLAAKSRSPLPLLWALPVIALILADEAQVERPVELYALASRFPFVSRSCWFKDVVGREISDIAATLPLDTLAAIEERGRAQDLEATAEGLLAEIKC